MYRGMVYLYTHQAYPTSELYILHEMYDGHRSLRNVICNKYLISIFFETFCVFWAFFRFHQFHEAAVE